MNKPHRNMKAILAKAELLQKIGDAVAEAKEAGVKDAPGIIPKALKANKGLKHLRQSIGPSNL